MLNKLSGWDDTIVAIATPPGIGAIGLIRLSGEKVFEIMDKLFPSKNILIQSSHTIHVGFIKEGGKDIDEVVLSLFKNPRSYTGEDVIEIGCHGSPFIQQQIVQACIKNGARLARHGEFTQRAFLKGKLDLTQAEAVADLIASNTAASQRTALHNIKGGFSIILKDLREQLIQFAALIELELDFATEDVEFADRTKFYALISSAQKTTSELLNSFQLGNVIKNGVSVAIIGKPNAGKSTLLNTLLNENRAIVSEIAGTTRDTIEEIINIEGILFRLIDTAGIRENSTDAIEVIGIEKSIEKMKTADVVLYIFDAQTESTNTLQVTIDSFKKQGIQYLLAANKSDILTKEVAVEKFCGIDNILFISAKNKYGIEELKSTLFNKTITSNIETENIVVSNTRHYAALQQVQHSLNEIKNGLDNTISGDLLAPDIRYCLHYLGEITGEVTNEDTLDYIFSKFCIGK